MGVTSGMLFTAVEHVMNNKEDSMKLFKRGMFAALMAAAATALLASSASATISPVPYSTSSGTGSFDTTSILGPGHCDLANITGSASTSSSATVTSFTVTGCSGVITGAWQTGSISISSPPGSASADIVLGIRNILGASCEYAGTFTGAASGTDTQRVSGTARLTSGGILCTGTANASLTVTFPGATIS